MNAVPSARKGLSLPICAILAALPALAHAQSVTLTMQSAEVIPGDEFDLSLLGNLDRPIRGFQVGVEFPSQGLTFLGARLEGSDLAGRRPAVFQTQSASGQAAVKLLLDDRPPIANDIPAGAAVRLLTLRFRLSQGLDPGAEFTVRLVGGLGFPPLPALIHVDSRTVAPAALVSGKVRVTDQNTLRIKDLPGVQPQSVVDLEITAFNVSPLQGFTVCIRSDPARVKFLDVDLAGTITEAVGADWVSPIFDNARGHFVLGVLLDAAPPFLGQVIPASGLSLTIAKVRLQALDAGPAGGSVELELVDGVGAPPIHNHFVIDNRTVAPVKRNGRLSIITDGPFIRGDVNEDGRLDITDPIAEAEWLFRDGFQVECPKAGDADDDGDTDLGDLIYSLRFLFLGGPALPAPFPGAGFDPTPDSLRCPL